MNLNAPARNSSRTLIIVLVIGGVVVLLSAALIIVVAVGFVVFSNDRPKPDHAYDPPRPTTNREPIDRSNALKTSASGDKTNALVEAMKDKPTIGGFALQNIIPQHSTRSFNNSQGEVKGVYTANGKTVSFLVAEYDGRARATVEFGRMLGRERSRGATVTEQINASGNRISAAFTNATNRYFAFCDWPNDSPVICHLVGSEDEKALMEFREGLSNGR